FGVALPEEGTELRQAGITRPILCLGGFWPEQETVLLEHKLTAVAYRLDTIESLDRAARDANTTANVHIKIDTGMGRLGVRADAAMGQFCDAVIRLKNIRHEGVMAHLAAADDESRTEVRENQRWKF